MSGEWEKVGFAMLSTSGKVLNVKVRDEWFSIHVGGLKAVLNGNLKGVDVKVPPAKSE